MLKYPTKPQDTMFDRVVDGEDVNHLKGEGDGEREEGERDLQELSPNTADTMRKINPLTIADQVQNKK